AGVAAREEGHRVEATNLRTESSSTFANPDGTLTSDITVGPVRAMTADGWQNIDPTLVVDGGRVHPKVTAAAISFTADGSGDAAVLADGAHILHVGGPGPLGVATVAGSVAS